MRFRIEYSPDAETHMRELTSLAAGDCLDRSGECLEDLQKPFKLIWLLCLVVELFPQRVRREPMMFGAKPQAAERAAGR